MAATDKNTLKSWFVRAAKPLATQFAAWIDSYWHKDDKIPISSIEDLDETLNDKATALYVDNSISEAMKNVSVNDASLQAKGIVQLSDTLGDDNTKAATPALVKQVNDTLVDNYYTRASVESIIAEQIVGLTWKDWVQLYSDLYTHYPAPEVGWLVPVADDSIIYKWNGTNWVDSKLGAIPAGLLKYTTGANNEPLHNGNELATKEYVNEHTPVIPDASITEKGIVQLSDIVENDSNKAVTGKAVLEILKDTNLVGEQGAQGATGPQGLNNFEIWLLQPGNEYKTVTDFFIALKGATGATGATGAAGANGSNGANGMDAYEQWRRLTGNTLKTFDDFLTFLAKRDGFMHNVLFYNYSDAQISYPYAGNINAIMLDNNIKTLEYSLDSGATYTAASGVVNINVGASSPIYLKVTFKTGQITGVITIKGSYL